MLLGARQECIAGGADIQEKMAILKSFGYDFLELSLSRAEIANLEPQRYMRRRYARSRMQRRRPA